jgi:glucose/mannose-6-phosphate isomerase
MIKIDDKSYINSLDKKQIFTSLLYFPKQCKEGFDTVYNLDIPAEYKNSQSILACAMGGSILGAYAAKYLFEKELKIPFITRMGYEVPSFVNQETLTILVSTSGSTEETLASYQDATKKTKKIFCMTTGKQLAQYAQRDGFPLYLIDPKKYNPSNVPRFAVGFQLGAYLAILSKLGFINLEIATYEKTISFLETQNEKIKTETSFDGNLAKQLAGKIQGKVPIYIASEALSGVAKTFTNQTNESARTFAAFFELPDMNHHQLEGLSYPKSNKDNLIYFFIESDLYSQQNKKRYAILKSILDDVGIGYLSYKPESDNLLGQTFEAIQFATHMTYYLGLLNGDDPAPNPFVDEFKKRLGSYSFESFL